MDIDSADSGYRNYCSETLNPVSFQRFILKTIQIPWLIEQLFTEQEKNYVYPLVPWLLGKTYVIGQQIMTCKRSLVIIGKTNAVAWAGSANFLWCEETMWYYVIIYSNFLCTQLACQPTETTLLQPNLAVHVFLFWSAGLCSSVESMPNSIAISVLKWRFHSTAVTVFKRRGTQWQLNTRSWYLDFTKMLVNILYIYFFGTSLVTVTEIIVLVPEKDKVLPEQIFGTQMLKTSVPYVQVPPIPLLVIVFTQLVVFL